MIITITTCTLYTSQYRVNIDQDQMKLVLVKCKYYLWQEKQISMEESRIALKLLNQLKVKITYYFLQCTRQ